MSGKIIGGLAASAALASRFAVAATILPTGVVITPKAIPGARFERLDPQRAALPDYRAGQPVAIRLAPDGSRLYASTGRGHQVFTIDTATNTVVGSVEVGARPWGIALSLDAKTLYSANGPSNDVSVVDLATNTVTKKIKAGKGPWGLVVLAR